MSSNTTNENSTNDMQERKAGALWIKTSQKGSKYLSIQVEIEGKKYNLMGFDNKFYSENPDTQPKYKLFFTQDTFDTLNKTNIKVVAPAVKVKKEIKPVESEDIDL